MSAEATRTSDALPGPPTTPSSADPTLATLRSALTTPQANTAVSARAARLERFNRRPAVAARPTLQGPLPAAPAAQRATRRNRILWGLAALLMLVLAGLLVAAWQHNQALEAEVAALQTHVTTLQNTTAQQTSRESDLNTVLRLQKEKLAGQDAQIQSAGQDLQGLQQDLQDLRARMNRLDQHNAELRDALGLSDPNSAAPGDVTTPTLTVTPGPNGFLAPAEGGETGPLLALALAPPLSTPAADSGDILTSYRAQIAEISHSLDVYAQIEDNLTSFAADRIQQWAQTDEDDSDTAPPDVTVSANEPPTPDTGTAPGRTPSKARPTAAPAHAPAASHVPSGYPYYGIITSPFGWRSSPFVAGKVGFHKGLDIAAPLGTPVRATQAGRVIEAGWSDVYGRVVMIDHGAGWQTLYGHNSRLLVKVGDWVDKGEVISYSGSTGMSTGPHIHYEIHYNGTLVNPAKYR